MTPNQFLSRSYHLPVGKSSHSQWTGFPYHFNCFTSQQWKILLKTIFFFWWPAEVRPWPLIPFSRIYHKTVRHLKKSVTGDPYRTCQLLLTFFPIMGIVIFHCQLWPVTPFFNKIRSFDSFDQYCVTSQQHQIIHSVFQYQPN